MISYIKSSKEKKACIVTELSPSCSEPVGCSNSRYKEHPVPHQENILFPVQTCHSAISLNSISFLPFHLISLANSCFIHSLAQQLFPLWLWWSAMLFIFNFYVSAMLLQLNERELLGWCWFSALLGLLDSLTLFQAFDSYAEKFICLALSFSCHANHSRIEITLHLLHQSHMGWHFFLCSVPFGATFLKGNIGASILHENKSL